MIRIGGSSERHLIEADVPISVNKDKTKRVINDIDLTRILVVPLIEKTIAFVKMHAASANR